MWLVKGREFIGPLGLLKPAEKILEMFGPARRFDDWFTGDCSYSLSFDEDGFGLLISAEGVVTRVSVYRPRHVVYRGVQLLGRPIADVERELRDAGLACEPLDIGLYEPSAWLVLVETDGVVDGVQLEYPPDEV